MKNAYITFLNHCYIDTEVEMKEIYNSQHIYTLIENSFCPDIEKVSERSPRCLDNGPSDCPRHSRSS